MTTALINVEYDASGGIRYLQMPRTSNWHAHLRLGQLMAAVAGIIMRPHKYVLAMPNNGYHGRPIETLDDVHHYYREIIAIRDELGYDTELVMTLYFTEKLTPDIVFGLARMPFRCEVKYYPTTPGATTGSGFGMTLEQGRDTLRAMKECGIPLLGHFESTHDAHGNEIPHAEREGYFMTEEYPRLRDDHPELMICVEHASTAIAVEAVKADTSGRTVMTVTPHHLLFTMEELLGKSWKNHGRCMPYLKTAADRAALQDFVFSGDARAIAGDDTAPHPSATKEGSFESAMCGCWLPHAIGLYIMAARDAGRLDDDFVRFMSYNGAIWRGLDVPHKDDRITVVGAISPNDIPDPVAIPGGSDVVIPLGWTEEADRLQIGHALLGQMHCGH